MRTLFWLVLAPFLGAAVVTLMSGHSLPSARACECGGDSFWVVEDVAVQGAVADWPAEGHLYPDRLQLWAAGFHLELDYDP